MSKSVICYFQSTSEKFNFSTGQDLSMAIDNIKSIYNLDENVSIICCLNQCFNQKYQKIITKIPLTFIPDQLYFYKIENKIFEKMFKTITVIDDDTTQCPTLQFIISVNQNVAQLENVFKIMKGYPDTLSIAFSMNERNLFEQIPHNFSISHLGVFEVELLSKKKIIKTRFELNEEFHQKFQLQIGNFKNTARQIVHGLNQKGFKNPIQINNKKIYFVQNGIVHEQNKILTPAYQSSVTIKIQNIVANTKQQKTMLFTNQKFEQSVYKPVNQKIKKNIKIVPSIKQQKQKQQTNIAYSYVKKQTNISDFIAFKQLKQNLRKTFQSQSNEEQNLRVKDLIAIYFRTIVN